MPTSAQCMQRCLQLASQAAGFTAPNPMVGAVLVHDDKIIGEGLHQHYGGPHAEVNCIANAEKKLAQHNNPEEIQQIIAGSTLYVSLEPCAHFGKTPPCADLIIQKNIGKVVIGCRDPFEAVNGKGIEKLQKAGIAVQSGILEKECIALNKRFFTFHQQHRPYIILKWAQTANGMIDSLDGQRLLISNAYSNRLVHRWRSEEAGILIGTNTALQDDPQLTNRYWYGAGPLRLVLDKQLRLPASLKLFKGDPTTIVFNQLKHSLTYGVMDGNQQVQFYQLPTDGNMVRLLSDAFTALNIQSILVEGGTQLIQSFIDEGYWDEARVICNTAMAIDDGLAAPVLKNARADGHCYLQNDLISFFTNKQFHS